MSNAGAFGIAGILIGAVVAIGITLYEAYQRSQEQEENQYRHRGGGNRFRYSDPTGPSPKSPEKNPPKQKAVCKKCELPFGGREIERPDCKIHVFHAACVKGMLNCQVFGCKGKFLSKQQTKEPVKPAMFSPRRPPANDLFRPSNDFLKSEKNCLSFGGKGNNFLKSEKDCLSYGGKGNNFLSFGGKGFNSSTRNTNLWSNDYKDRSLRTMDSDSDLDYSD